MVKLTLSFFVLTHALSVLACEPESQMRTEAIRMLYADPDLTRYVCVANPDCGMDEFAAQLDVTPVALSPSALNSKVQGLLISPTRKGSQFFSAVYMLEQCRYVMVFAPDTTFSDLKVIPKVRSGFYMLRAVERDSADTWKEYDYSFDLGARQYSNASVHCYRFRHSTKTAVPCD